MLFIGGQALGSSDLELVLDSVELREACASFLNSPICVYHRSKAIHVFQGEVGRVGTGSDSAHHLGPDADSVQYIGSTDATTCVITVLLDAGAGWAVVAHYDESTATSAASLQACLQGMSAPSLYMVGGYNDRRGTGRQTCASLLSFYHASPLPITLQLCCVADHNTDPDTGAPRCQSLAVNLRTQEAFPATFRDRGPMAVMRLAQLWAREDASQLRHTYDPTHHRITLPLVLGAPHGRMWSNFRFLLHLDDPALVQLVSTSPEHEGPGFVEDMRGALGWLLGQQGPRREVIYTFQWAAHGWQPVASAIERQPQEQEQISTS